MINIFQRSVFSGRRLVWGKDRLFLKKIGLIFSSLVLANSAFSADIEPGDVAKVFSSSECAGKCIHMYQDPRTGDFLVPGTLLELISLQSQFEGEGISVEDLEHAMRNEANLPHDEEPTVAIIDTGILEEHPLLRKRIKTSKDFTGEGKQDLNGHGTGIATMYVLPPREERWAIINAKAFRKDGTGSFNHLVDALEWSVEQDADIINVSAGIFLPCMSEQVYDNPPAEKSCESLRICQIVGKAADKNVAIVASVGNTPGKIACPACCKLSISVGDNYSNTGALMVFPTRFD